MYKLKGCPICNADVKLMFLNCEIFEDAVWDESVVNVPTWFKCYGCDSEFFHDEPIDIPEKQIEWWNTRKPLERIIERLEEEYKTYNSNSYEDDFIAQGVMIAIEIVSEEGGMND